MVRPTARVLALLALLQAGGTLTVADLAQRLAVDERTLRRYVEHLRDLDVPVETVRGRYICRRNDFARALVRALAHEILVMKDGRIVEAGTADAILDAPQHPYTKALMTAAFELAAASA